LIDCTMQNLILETLRELTYVNVQFAALKAITLEAMLFCKCARKR